METELANQPNLDHDEHDEQMLAKSPQELDQLVDGLVALYRQKSEKPS